MLTKLAETGARLGPKLTIQNLTRAEPRNGILSTTMNPISTIPFPHATK